MINFSIDGVKYNIARLQELGLLERIGSKRGGTWLLTDSALDSIPK